MTQQPTGSLRGLLTRTNHYYATCWRITRTDGIILRLTDTGMFINSLGETFDPADGMDPSAIEAAAGLSSQNFTITGVLSDSRITHDDLRAGRYIGAQIDVILVDWRHPWIQHFTQIFFVQKTVWVKGIWKAEIVGLTGKLQRNQGDVYSRTCRHELGDPGCKFDLSLLRQNSRSVNAVSSQRLKFTSTTGSQSDDFFNYGNIVWKTGANTGLVNEIFDYVDVTGEITLRIPTKFDIAASDTFDIFPGCDKQRSTNISKFNNLENFGGFPFLPGQDRLIEIGGDKN